MRVENLPFVPAFLGANNVRVEAAKTISYAELYADQAGKQTITDFFMKCATMSGGTTETPMPPGSAMVKSTDQFQLFSSRGAAVGRGQMCTLAMYQGKVDGVLLPSSVAGISNNDVVGVRIFGSPDVLAGRAIVANGDVSEVTLNGSIGFVSAGNQNVPITGTFVSKISATVVNGQLKGYVLS
jgi:hypothetical protein